MSVASKLNPFDNIERALDAKRDQEIRESVDVAIDQGVKRLKEIIPPLAAKFAETGKLTFKITIEAE